jgi:anthranilate synthase component 2
MALIAMCVGKFPIMGICLGHQALIQHYGGSVMRAPEVKHGKSSNIVHNQTGAFLGFTTPLPVARYHSLVASNIPAELTITAHFTIQHSETLASTDLVMAIEHPQDAVLGFQFHPESILTTYGTHLLAQSLCHLTTLYNQHHASQVKGA